MNNVDKTSYELRFFSGNELVVCGFDFDADWMVLTEIYKNLVAWGHVIH